MNRTVEVVIQQQESESIESVFSVSQRGKCVEM